MKGSRHPLSMVGLGPPASVNREFEMLSRLFNLAIDFKKAESNPCSRVRKFKLDNERYIRAVQLQREVRPEPFVHKLATQEIRPPLLAAVSF
jgi:hypothetical protein